MPEKKNVLHPDKNGVLTLCGGGDDCCPTIEEMENGKFKLTDDDGGTATLTADQVKLFHNADLSSWGITK